MSDRAVAASANSTPLIESPKAVRVGGTRYYLIAVGGTAMAPLASLLIEKGHRVIGSDRPLYPPMSDRIAALGIDVRPGFAAENLPDDIDRVVVGNLAGRDNPEVLEALRRGLPVASMPETLRLECLSGRHPVVIAGTHGKTTTSALTAWCLASAGLGPGYLIGGEPLNFTSPAALGGAAAPFVVEGDEYSTSYNDRGPKFLHYAPRTLVITSVEFDHSDLYSDLEDVKNAFRRVVASVPPDGRIVANGDDPNVLDVLEGARARIVIYRVSDRHGVSEDGLDERPDPDVYAKNLVATPEGVFFDFREGGQPERGPRFFLPLAGRHNVSNSLAAISVGRSFGLTTDVLGAALATFRGVRRRLEERGTAAGVTVLDDFAHHPTAVAATLAAARDRFPGRRLWAAFEPRSLTGGRRDFEDAYLRALGQADGIAVVRPFHEERLARSGVGALDVERLSKALEKNGRIALWAHDGEELSGKLPAYLHPGDVVIAMSSGGFGGFCARLLTALRAGDVDAPLAATEPVELAEAIPA